jgi:hypothetical protein
MRPLRKEVQSAKAEALGIGNARPNPKIPKYRKIQWGLIKAIQVRIMRLLRKEVQ